MELICLLSPLTHKPGILLESSPHEHAQGAIDFRFEVADGFVIATVWRGAVHKVIYQTPAATIEAAEKRNALLFEFYGAGHSWKEVLDNGFGKTYRRADMMYFALWSYTMDFVSFGTMEFHEVMWG